MTPDERKTTVDESRVIGQRGRIIGDHPWAGHHGEIVRVEKTLVGWGVVVRLDDEAGQECFIFDGRKYWLPNPRMSSFLIEWLSHDPPERFRIDKAVWLVMASDAIQRAAARRLLEGLRRGESHRARTITITRL